MLKWFVIAASMLATQVLLVAPAVHGGGPPDPSKPPEAKAKLDVTIILHFPRETRQVMVKMVLDALERLKVKETLVRVPEAGKGTYAEIVAAAGVRSQDVAVIVRTLVDLGIKKIAIDIKK